jgi:hypothetical protein
LLEDDAVTPFFVTKTFSSNPIPFFDHRGGALEASNCSVTAGIESVG